MLTLLLAVAFGQVVFDSKPNYDAGTIAVVTASGIPKGGGLDLIAPDALTVLTGPAANVFHMAAVPGSYRVSPRLYTVENVGGTATVVIKKLPAFMVTFVPPPPKPIDPDNPIDPPSPVRPLGWAGEVFDEAVKVKAPADCKRIAAKLRELAKAIEAKQLTRAEDVPSWFKSYLQPLGLGPAWRPFGDWSIGQLQIKVQTLDEAVTVFKAAAEGLEAAGGK